MSVNRAQEENCSTRSLFHSGDSTSRGREGDPLTVYFLKTDEKATHFPFPKKATPGSAAFDMFCPEDITLSGQRLTKIDMKIRAAFPDTFCAILLLRSGVATDEGLRIPAGSGLIDSDFTKSIVLPIYNSGVGEYKIHMGQRIAQLLFLPIPKVSVVACRSPWEFPIPPCRCDHQHQGFGSTGRF